MKKETILELEKQFMELLKGPKRSNEPKVMNKKTRAAELHIQLQQDEEYQKWLKKKEEVRSALEAAYAQEEKPLVDDLVKAGLNVKSSWDLVNSSKSYRNAIPILIEHLSKPYHLKNKEGIARALAVKEAKGVACRPIIEEYKKTPKDEQNLRWVYGNTMEVIITEDYLDEIIDIIKDESNGDSRQMFIAALGNLGSSKAKNILYYLVKDKSRVVNEEAKKALKKII